MKNALPWRRARNEFHVSRRVRDRYGFDLSIFESTGNVVFADFRAARLFADRMNEQRDLEAHPEQAVKASEINAMGLVDEMLHAVVARYRETVRPRIFADALRELGERVGKGRVAEVLRVFIDEFPPVAVYRGEISVEDYLEGTTDGSPNREIAVEELALLRLANTNPAFAPFHELFDDSRLRNETAYDAFVASLEASFAGRPGLDEDGTTLLDLLLAPVRAAPTSLEGQLGFISAAWAGHLDGLEIRILPSLDFVAEENRPFFGVGPGPVDPPDYSDTGDAPERYSPDLDWMPRVVLLAKNVHVWLHQLSEQYGRGITTLDQVPDEELDRLAHWGFTGLWLIGVWERSRASATIKRWMGDDEAVASAYSLADYAIAGDLGGEWAYDDLKGRAFARGIRLSTDMVPNHMGIDSRWLVEHPDWFIGLDESPFPSYRFTGADLCDDERVGIQIEDGYWNRSDAAVVFRRIDHWTGDTRYIYHGNDGTSMPWNDTAQLDYRKAEVREAVIQTILHVARRSPIIRFDAAMTLAKQHYHRLWFPAPGTGGDIPSRAEHGMSRAAFDEVMPEEFWREVVDRVAQEAPDTLLLAEAFWLLEGYFVRTLGMHRVYNSAFMNMLRDERNADYRLLIKSTLEFDPQILKRYVNFMSNPDERTAVDQFGTDGKYFGVAAMMATLPGLPMFGHGQVEGFAEKYGMEFRRPRWEETPDADLVRRHERQLFPLLHRRGSFAEVDRFLLYDFEAEGGGVDENVFAYSNDVGGERSLVVFNNTFGDTRGRLRMSTAKLVRDGSGGEELVRFGLAEGLGVGRENESFICFRDAVSGLEYLRPSRRIVDEGLFLELDAYRCHVFVDFAELEDADGTVRRLEAELEGRGIDSVELALGELEHRDVLEPWAELLSVENLAGLKAAREAGGDGSSVAPVVGDVLEAFVDLVNAVLERETLRGEPEPVVRALRRDLERLLRLADDHEARVPEGDDQWIALVAWLMLRSVAEAIDLRSPRDLRAKLFAEWHMGRVLRRQAEAAGVSPDAADRVPDTVRLLVDLEGWWCERDGAVDLRSLFEELTDGDPGRSYLGVNQWESELWYRAEAMEELLGWFGVAAEVDAGMDDEAEPSVIEALERLQSAHRAGGYRVAAFLEALELE
ncbi:MAG: alpha-amylase family glycosyl hydrolase [Thermoanaerobaculales bacterium]|jgi:glycosidase|nr:alpha-amylase family glycosyl hydrolase [Thermoanaerobaculales bacterium]